MKRVFNNRELARVYTEQEASAGRNHNGSLYFEGPSIWSYGPHFPLAYINGQVAYVNQDKYSMTTSHHQSRVVGALANAGYEVVYMTTEQIKAFTERETTA